MNSNHRPHRLHGKSVLITGASSGIGRACAQLFAEHGANLVLGGRRAHVLETLAHELQALGVGVVPLAGDVSDESWHRRAVELAIGEFGKLDAALNNAGSLGVPGPLHELALPSWNALIETNLTGAFLGAKHQVPEMLRAGAGSIVFTGSFVGHTIGLAGMAAYGASKAGLVGLSQCLAAELGPRGIRVNALLPGGTATPMAGDFASRPEDLQAIERLHALGRIAHPDEIAQAAMFLVGDDSSFVTGTAMLVDGGNSIYKG